MLKLALTLMFTISFQSSFAVGPQQDVEKIESLSGTTYYIVKDAQGNEQLKSNPTPNSPALACGREFIDFHRANQVYDHYDSQLSFSSAMKGVFSNLIRKLHPSCKTLEASKREACEKRAKAYNPNRHNGQLLQLAREITEYYYNFFNQCQSKIIPATEGSYYDVDVEA